MADCTSLSCSLTPALEESRMALILMFIVVTYMVTNTPRMILNFYEFLVSEQRQKDKHCHIHPRWEWPRVVIRKNLTEISKYFPRLIQNSLWCNSKYYRWIAPLTMLSMLMLTFNSSVNLFIYCFCNTIFRYNWSFVAFCVWKMKIIWKWYKILSNIYRRELVRKWGRKVSFLSSCVGNTPTTSDQNSGGGGKKQ